MFSLPFNAAFSSFKRPTSFLSSSALTFGSFLVTLETFQSFTLRCLHFLH